MEVILGNIVTNENLRPTENSLGMYASNICNYDQIR